MVDAGTGSITSGVGLWAHVRTMSAEVDTAVHYCALLLREVARCLPHLGEQHRKLAALGIAQSNEAEFCGRYGFGSGSEPIPAGVGEFDQGGSPIAGVRES